MQIKALGRTVQHFSCDQESLLLQKFKAEVAGMDLHTIHHRLNCLIGDFYRNEIRFLISFMMTYCCDFSFLLGSCLKYKVENLREPCIVFFLYLKCWYNQSEMILLPFPIEEIQLHNDRVLFSALSL